MASDLSGQASVGSGYGGGGAGGGEYSSKKFARPSTGAGGAVFVIEVRAKKCEVIPRVRVRHNGADHRILCLRPTDSFYTTSTSHSKMTINHNSGLSKPARSFNSSMFRILDDASGEHPEFTSVGNVTNGVVCQTKAIHNGVRFSALYCTDDDGTVNFLDNKLYPVQVIKHSFTSGTSSGTLGSPDCDVLFLFVIAQGAGGGGGGSDNSWSIGNYAAGGGGGGAGGAIAASVIVPNGTVSYYASIGAGGAGGNTGNHDGSASAGSIGGETSISFTNVNDAGDIVMVYASGGVGGGKPGKDTNGSGGAGGGGAIYTGNRCTFSYTKVLNVEGGAGASRGTGGTATVYERGTAIWNWLNLFPVSLSVDESGGSGGTTGSQDDRGGGGGASWLGNGGYY